MNIKSLIKNAVVYLKDQNVDIRIRMTYFLEYASLLVCLIGTTGMILLKQPVSAMIPNIILFIISFIGLYLSHIKKRYDLSTFVIIFGCANIALPWMFFTAGGNDSGMLIWFLFGVVVTCMMSNGNHRMLMAVVTIAEDILCICIGHFFPQTITPLVGKNTVFYDELQSYSVVCVFLVIMLTIYISIYDNQRKQLEAQKKELKNIMQTDALTGVLNRRAYYDEINTYQNSKNINDLVLVSMDVNGLKKINDLLGHSAGDDYIRAAANAICNALGQYGQIFRTGGDEFMAILHCSPDEANCFEDRINECITKLDNPWTENMAIAVGIVCCEENPEMSFDDIEKLADKRMYDNKSAYYKRTGIDRRR